LSRRYRVRLTASADRDLDQLYACIAQNRSADDAIELIDALLDRIATLERFPDRGSIPSELAAFGEQGFRQILHLPYRIIYERRGSLVWVHVIADGRRDMQTLLSQRLLST
jgi:toxin ParE1/3/4